MKNPFNSDLSQQGTKSGAEDAAGGKPKDVSGMGGEAKTWVFGKPAMDSYSKSYHQAYDNESAKRQGVYQTAPSTPPFSMAAGNTTSVNTLTITGNAIHATIKPDKVAAFLDTLRLFQRQMLELTQAMNNTVINLEGHQWNDANYHDFVSRWGRVRTQVEHIDNAVIDQQAAPQLERVIAAARNVRTS
jgi:hypothetical protein